MSWDKVKPEEFTCNKGNSVKMKTELWVLK